MLCRPETRGEGKERVQWLRGSASGALTSSGVWRFAPPFRSTASASALPLKAAIQTGVVPFYIEGGGGGTLQPVKNYEIRDAMRF